MAKNRPDPDATYLRSALISMGLALFFLGAFVGYRDAMDLAVAVLIGGFGIGGLGLIAAGLFLPTSKDVCPLDSGVRPVNSLIIANLAISLCAPACGVILLP